MALTPSSRQRAAALAAAETPPTKPAGRQPVPILPVAGERQQVAEAEPTEADGAPEAGDYLPDPPMYWLRAEALRLVTPLAGPGAALRTLCETADHLVQYMLDGTLPPGQDEAEADDVDA